MINRLFEKNIDQLIDYQNNCVAAILILYFLHPQEIRNQASEYPYKVAKLPANRNLNRYRDVSPCKSCDTLHCGLKLLHFCTFILTFSVIF